jgi:hypothetical protein
MASAVNKKTLDNYDYSGELLTARFSHAAK